VKAATSASSGHPKQSTTVQVHAPMHADTRPGLVVWYLEWVNRWDGRAARRGPGLPKRMRIPSSGRGPQGGPRRDRYRYPFVTADTHVA
jgi:hypothetical protein